MRGNKYSPNIRPTRPRTGHEITTSRSKRPILKQMSAIKEKLKHRIEENIGQEIGVEEIDQALEQEQIDNLIKDLFQNSRVFLKGGPSALKVRKNTRLIDTINSGDDSDDDEYLPQSSRHRGMKKDLNRSRSMPALHDSDDHSINIFNIDQVHSYAESNISQHEPRAK